jgi:thioredoxin 1
MATFSELIESTTPTLVDFTATWCGPCKTMAPILEDLKAKMGDNVTIIKIDIDKNENAARSFDIQSVPTFLLFKEGKQLWRKSGVIPASELMLTIESFSK